MKRSTRLTDLIPNAVLVIVAFNPLLNAEAATAPITGRCGFVLNRNVDGFEAYHQGDAGGSSGMASRLSGIMDFNALTVEVTATLIDNYNTNTAINRETEVFTLQGSLTPTPVSNMYTLNWSGPAPDWSDLSLFFNMIATNGGKTFLIKSIAGAGTDRRKGAWTGVCQSI